MSTVELCLKLLDDLNAHERAQVARKINSLNKEALNTTRDADCARECQKLCDAVLDSTGLVVQGKSREIRTVCARRYVCKALKDMGFSFSSIGKALGINHSSVIFHVKMARDSEEYPKFYPEYHDVKKKVRERLYSSD